MSGIPVDHGKVVWEWGRLAKSKKERFVRLMRKSKSNELQQTCILMQFKFAAIAVLAGNLWSLLLKASHSHLQPPPDNRMFRDFWFRTGATSAGFFGHWKVATAAAVAAVAIDASTQPGRHLSGQNELPLQQCQWQQTFFLLRCLKQEASASNSFAYRPWRSLAGCERNCKSHN